MTAKSTTARPADRLEVTVVVPTFNERANVAKLVSKVDAVLTGKRWQIIFVDEQSTGWRRPRGQIHRS